MSIATTPVELFTVNPAGGPRSDHVLVPVPRVATKAVVVSAVLTVVIKGDPPLITINGLTVIDSTLITETPKLSVAVKVS